MAGGPALDHVKLCSSGLHTALPSRNSDSDIRALAHMQIDAAHVSTCDAWKEVLQRTVHTAAAALGLPPECMVSEGGSSCHFELRLLQLRLCGREGVSAQCGIPPGVIPGVFATVRAQLPCVGGHEGGKLVLTRGAQL